MTPKPKDDSLRDLGISFVVLIGGLGGLLSYSQNLTVTPPRRVTLQWDNPAETPGSYTVEVWSTTNLSTWTLKTNVSNTNSVTLPADKPREFFKIRSRGTNGMVSDWSRKP